MFFMPPPPPLLLPSVFTSLQSLCVCECGPDFSQIYLNSNRMNQFCILSYFQRRFEQHQILLPGLNARAFSRFVSSTCIGVAIDKKININWISSTIFVSYKCTDTDGGIESDRMRYTLQIMDTLQIHNTHRPLELTIPRQETEKAKADGNNSRKKSIELRRHLMLLTYVSPVLHNKIEPIVFTPDNSKNDIVVRFRRACVCTECGGAHLHTAFRSKSAVILKFSLFTAFLYLFRSFSLLLAPVDWSLKRKREKNRLTNSMRV